MYDVAYLSKNLTRKNIPDSDYNELINTMGYALGGEIYDVKLMVESCLGEVKSLGLEKLSRMLAVESVREAHQAGSDSLLSAKLFLSLSQGASYRFIHKVFGVSLRIDNRPWEQIAVQLQQQRYMLQQYRYVSTGCYGFFDRQYCALLGRCRPILSRLFVMYPCKKILCLCSLE